MKAVVRELLGLAVALVSFVGSIITCALPQWIVTETSDFQVYYGLWKYCGTASKYTNPTVCRAYDDKTFLIPGLAGARAPIVIAIIFEIIGILLGVAGRKFINFVPDERKKSEMTMASGAVFLIAGLFVLVSVCWISNTTAGKVEFVSLHTSVKWALGAAVYIGWLTTVLLFLGGGLLCSSFLCRDGTN